MKPLSKEEAIALVKGSFGEQALKLTANYVAPLFWIWPDGAQSLYVRNGSIFFVDSGKALFAVTTNHVFEEYLEKKTAFPKLICQIHDLKFLPEQRLIDSSKELDIATFRIKLHEIKSINKVALTKWPPIIPQTDKAVMFAGFPGRERLYDGALAFNFGIYTNLTIATSVSDRNIKCQFEREEWLDPMNLGVPPEGSGFGGMSGGPLITVLEQKGLWSWTLGGIITQFNSAYEILIASRGDKILPDGMLIK